MDEQPAPGPAATALYFICAEAVSNAVKHAAAEHIRIHLYRSDARFRLEVTDTGRGRAMIGDGTGLQGLLDRVRAMGGSLDLVSPPGIGTTVSVEIPDSGSDPLPDGREEGPVVG